MGYDDFGGYDSARKWGAGSDHAGKKVDCGDCHNWQFEVLGQALQSETIGAEDYSRPSKDQRIRHPQREMVSGGLGGEDGSAGLWGVEPTGPEMGSTQCSDCHMPRTHKEGMPADDDGSPEATRQSHRFHPVLPGDAKQWRLRPGGDSCVAECHKDAGRDEWSRDEFQAWVDEVQVAVDAKSDEASSALDSIADEYGLTDWMAFAAAKPAAPAPAASIGDAEWTMLQRAAQNLDFVLNDASHGVHNAAYAEAGLDKAVYWGNAYNPDFTISVDPGYRNGVDGVVVEGSLRGRDGGVLHDGTVLLEASSDGGNTWEVRGFCRRFGDGHQPSQRSPVR